MAETSLALVRRSDHEMVELATNLSKSTLLPKAMQGKVADVLVTIMAGQEMGLAPMASLRAFHVIEGKPVMSSDGMVALILGSGRAQYFDLVSESDTSVTYETLRVGAKVPQQCTWTWEMAKKAALHQKDNWRCYPRQMLASRAKAELARRVYPDVLMGCYSDDEASGWNDARARDARDVRLTEPIQDAEFVDSSPVVDQLHAIEMAGSFAELEALIPMLKTLTGAVLLDGRRRYAERKTKLEKEASERKVQESQLGSVAPGPYSAVVAANPYTGTMCSACGTPQVMTPSGATCKFGHGGAAPAPEAA
jgi:hypothetical protein